MSESAHIMRALYDVISGFGRRILRQKRRRGIIDYADAENLTLDLLTHDGNPTALAERIASDYDEIYIDEYQDINPVQDAIFSALAHGNRFMVGDIKQSIYRFRGAEPDIFSDYRSRFAKLSHPEDAGEDGRTVFLSNNFRCDRSVTGFVNDVFRRIMTPLCGSALSYTEDDELVCSKVEEKRTRPEARTRIVLIAPEPTFDADDGSEDAAQGADVSGGTDSAGMVKTALPTKAAARLAEIITASTRHRRPRYPQPMRRRNTLPPSRRGLSAAECIRRPIYASLRAPRPARRALSAHFAVTAYRSLPSVRFHFSRALTFCSRSHCCAR